MSRRTDVCDSRGGAGRLLSWAVFALLLLAHVSGAMILRDYLAHKRPITPPQPIVVTLIDAEEDASADAPPQPSAEETAPTPRAQTPAPRQETPPPEPVTPPPEPVTLPLAPVITQPQPAPEPAVTELPAPPPVPPEAAPEAAPAVAPAAQPAQVASAPGPLQPSSPVAQASSQPASSLAAPAAKNAAPASPPRVNAAYLDNPKPAYPLSARSRRLEGTVRLRVFVSAAGAVEQIEVQQTSGSPVLDRSALDAVKHWKFVPARQGEEAVPAWVVIPIVFTLKG